MSSSINQASNGKALGEATETLSDVLQKFLSSSSLGTEIVDRVEGLDSLGSRIVNHPKFKSIPSSTKKRIYKILNQKIMNKEDKEKTEPQKDSLEYTSRSVEFRMGYAKGIALSQMMDNSNGQVTGVLKNILDGQYKSKYLQGLHKGASDHEKSIHGDRIAELKALENASTKSKKQER